MAAIRPPVALYREDQTFAWWLYALVALMVGMFLVGMPPTRLLAGAGDPHGLRSKLPYLMILGATIPPLLIVGVLHMSTEVDAEECRVWFGWVPTYRSSVRLADVLDARVVQYRPIRDLGFWGARRLKDGDHSLTARGDRGVLLKLADGTTVLIGSQRPEELASAILRQRRFAC